MSMCKSLGSGTKQHEMMTRSRARNAQKVMNGPLVKLPIELFLKILAYLPLSAPYTIRRKNFINMMKISLVSKGLHEMMEEAKALFHHKPTVLGVCDQCGFTEVSNVQIEPLSSCYRSFLLISPCARCKKQYCFRCDPGCYNSLFENGDNCDFCRKCCDRYSKCREFCESCGHKYKNIARTQNLLREINGLNRIHNTNNVRVLCDCGNLCIFCHEPY